jgi:3-hydroxybutyryl-CoA dehydrogenase
MGFATAGIVGAGTMGAGIATNLAQHGLAVRLVDVSDDVLARGLAAAESFYQRGVERGRMEAADATAALARITTGTALDGLAGCDLVIEAVFEDHALKAELFGKLNGILADDTVITTNTSCLRVGDLAKHVANPRRFLGTHYFNPAAINPIVEVVSGPDTDVAVVDRVVALLRHTGKQPLRCRDSYGFALNRYFCPYTNEAARALDDGLGSTAQIDRVATECLGAAAGPFRVMNLVKPRINLHAIRNMAPLGSFYAPADSMVRIGEAEADWQIDQAPAPDAAADKAIADRLLGGTFLAILQELDEGVAAPADLDLGAAQAFKFGKPPCALMDAMGRAEVQRLVAPLAERYGLKVPDSLARVGRLVS